MTKGDAMKMKRVLRRISLGMLVIAVVFTTCALCCPQYGSTVCIGSFRFGAEQWIVCYKLYVLVMLSLFAGAFLVKDR